FQRIPSRTVVYPTIYGRMRQGRARLTAGDISRLDEVPYLDGYRPNLIDAIKLNAADLAVDPAALKVLLVVTDGRDFADPKGEGPGKFAELGAQLRRAGITLLAVRYRPEADAAQAAANLRDLHDAAGGFLSARDQIEDLENTLESLGQAVADLQRVEVEVPWTWRLLGGEHRFSTRLTGADGETMTIDAGTVTVGPGGARWLMFALILAAGATAAGMTMLAFRRRGGPGAPVSAEALVAAAHDLIRRGASPERAAEELVRRFPEAPALLAGMDEALLVDPRFPYLRTRPGRKRMQEIRELVAERSGDSAGLGESLARVLAEAVAGQMPAEQAAEKVNAHATAEERAAFVGLDLDRLAESLRGAARAHPPLGTPRARGIAVAIQDALRTGEKAAQGVAVGWLVRAGGPGRRGETLRLAPERTVIGCSASCAVRIIEDPGIAPEHAEIVAMDEEFAIAPLGGVVRVEGQPVTRRQALVDGETIDLGGGMYVFKSAGVGNLATVRGTKSSIRR
ncbi:MAG TPA: FHA domain-containing protein, partial [Polyangia bacterium]|nr:FHA domain-containing protein [Polyangia bacterium]